MPQDTLVYSEELCDKNDDLCQSEDSVAEVPCLNKMVSYPFIKLAQGSNLSLASFCPFDENKEPTHMRKQIERTILTYL